MKIHERIHIVASGDSGFSITEGGDCTVYLLECGQCCALIDAGAGKDTEAILKNIAKAGRSPREVAAVFLTHGHGDHVGGAKALSLACGALVYGMGKTAVFVSAGDQEKMSIPAAVEAGVYEKGFSAAPCPVIPLQDGQETEVGDLTVKAHLTEGHCAGHGCYEVRIGEKVVLFAGDSVFCGGKISLQAIWDCNLQKYIDTCRRLQKIHPDALLPAHGRFVLNRGYAQLEKVMEKITRLEIPGGFGE